jgi:PDGLE domain
MRRPVGRRVFVALALAVAVGLATAVAPFASSAPDGLERVAGDQGFLDAGQAREAPVPDYAVPGIEDERLATGLAGFLGTLVVFGLALGAAALLRLRGDPAT